MKIAYQREPGAYSDEAVTALFPGADALDSRPMLGRPFEYRFYLDFSINGEAGAPAAAEAALEDLEEASAEIRLFGTDPSA